MANAGIPFEFFFDTRVATLACDGSALNSSTAHTFDTMSASQSKLYCPVSGSRTWRQVLLKINARWATNTSTIGITKLRYALQFAGGGFSSNVDISGTNLSTKAQSQEFTIDITSAVAAGFTIGTSVDFDVRVTFVTSSAGDLNAVTCSVMGVVEIDDASSQSMQTIYLPLDKADSAITGSLTEIRTNQWPDLDALIPYANKTYLNMALVLECNTNQGGGGAHHLSYALDSEAAVDRSDIQNGGVDGRFYDVWVRNDVDTSTAHAVKWKRSAATGIGVVKLMLVVTFSYDVPDPETSGGSFVSRMIPFVLCAGPMIENGASPILKVELPFKIAEANPVLKQSGLALDFCTTYGGGVSLYCDSQSAAQTYAGEPSHGHVSHHNATHRVDSGARFGAGVTLARGNVKLTMYAVEPGVFSSTGYSGFLVLNYVCDTPAAGDFAKTRTYRLQQSTSATTLGETTGPNHTRSGAASKVPTFPAAWALASPIAYDLKTLTQSDQFELRSARLYVGTLSGELPASSFVELGTGHEIQTCSPGYGHAWATVRFIDADFRKFYRWADDPDSDNRLDPEQQRNFRVGLNGSAGAQPAARMMLEMIVDWHAQAFTVSGQVTRSPVVSGLTMGVHRADTDEMVTTCTTDVDGNCSATVYDGSVDHYFQGIGDSSHQGRSQPVTPVPVT